LSVGGTSTGWEGGGGGSGECSSESREEAGATAAPGADLADAPSGAIVFYFLSLLFSTEESWDSRKRQGIKAHARFSLSKEKNSKKVMDRSKKGASESTKTFEENSSRTESETKMLFALPLCRA
jgi:hypothetical protein